ncbi:MAG: hypothetical protein ACI4JY_01625 [Oscillospiraceae bacterium]
MIEYSYTLGAAGERLKVVETDRTAEYEYVEEYRYDYAALCLRQNAATV